MLINRQSYYLPYIYAVASNMFFILAQFIAKLQTSLVSPMFILYFRSLILLIFNTFLISSHNQKHSKTQKQPQQQTINQPILHKNNQEQHTNLAIINLDIMNDDTFRLMIKRVLFACLSMAFYTISLKNIQLSITNALFETAPIFAFFIDALLNKIQILKIHLILTLLSFIGVVFILLPGKSHNSTTESIVSNDEHSNFLVYLLPLLSAFTSACSMSYLHKLKQKVHPLLTLQYLMIGALITSGILYNVDSNPIIHHDQTTSNSLIVFSSIFQPWFIWSTLLMSVLVYLSQYFRVKSLFILPASKVAPLHYFGIILSILFDLVVFDYHIKWYQYIGMALASSGLMMKLLIQRNQQQAKSSSSGSRQF